MITAPRPGSPIETSIQAVMPILTIGSIASNRTHVAAPDDGVRDGATTVSPMKRWATILVSLAVITAACGGGDGDSTATEAANGGTSSDGAAPAENSDRPSECDRDLPYTVRAEGLNEPTAGSPEFEVTHAFAQRIPVVPGESGNILEGAEKEAADEEARTTDLAIYAIHLADYPLERDQFDGFGFARPEVPEGGTLAVVSILPPTLDGLQAGDVVRHGEPQFESVTTFSTLSAVVQTAERDNFDNAFTDMDGQVEVLALDDESICVDIDITIRDGDESIAAIEGDVVAEVVRVSDAFYMT